MLVGCCKRLFGAPPVNRRGTIAIRSLPRGTSSHGVQAFLRSVNRGNRLLRDPVHPGPQAGTFVDVTGQIRPLVAEKKVHIDSQYLVLVRVVLLNQRETTLQT